MDSNKIDMYLIANASMFEGNKIPIIKERMGNLDDSKFTFLQTLPLKNPQTAIIISLLGGGLGIDRFYIGDTGKGVGKLLTCGGLGIWSIVDLFLIMKATREKNFEILMNNLMF